jgi:hypothetical protein
MSQADPNQPYKRTKPQDLRVDADSTKDDKNKTDSLYIFETAVTVDTSLSAEESPPFSTATTPFTS